MKVGYLLDVPLEFLLILKLIYGSLWRNWTNEEEGGVLHEEKGEKWGMVLLSKKDRNVEEWRSMRGVPGSKKKKQKWKKFVSW